MEKRLLDLLRLVTEEYVATANPVGSQYLVERYGMDVSPATIRNWFAELEETGCLAQPHVSGGRIPTERGFCLYVEHFVREKAVSKKDRAALLEASNVPEEDGHRMKQVAKCLAELSGLAVVVGLQRADTFYTGLSQLFSQPEFKNWQHVVDLTGILDHLDDALSKLRVERFPEPRALIGRSCPFGPVCSSVVVSVKSNMLGVLGPMRMDYQRATSLITLASELCTKSNVLSS